MFAARRREDDIAASGVRRGDDADELQRVPVERVTWIRNRDGLMWRKSLADRGSCVSGFSLRRTGPSIEDRDLSLGNHAQAGRRS